MAYCFSLTTIVMMKTANIIEVTDYFKKYMNTFLKIAFI